MAKRNTKNETQGWAGKPRSKVLLVEVSNDWIKLLEVSGARGGIELIRVHMEPVDHAMAISESLRAAINNGKFSRIPVLSCVPRQLINVRLLEFPSTDPVEVADMVELQIGRQTPYSVSEILSGYKTLGVTRQGTYTRVMLAIVQRSIVRERYYGIEASGLSVERMTVSSEGVLNWFLYRTRSEPSDRVMALLDVDSFFTHMIVVQQHKVVFTKSILWGASQAGEGLDVFVQRVKEAFRSCEEALRGDTIASVTVSGAGVHLKGVSDVLTTALTIPCQTADCLEDIKVGKGCEQVRDERYATASLTALIGMALAPNLLDFDFVPDVVRLREQVVKRTRMFSTMAGWLVSAMVSASLFCILACGYRLHRVAVLTAESDELQDRVVKVERMVEVIRATHDRQDSRFLPENLLPAIHQAIPAAVFLESLDINIQRERVTMGGTAPSRKDIRELIRLLEESPFFESVEEGGRTVMDRNERFVFQVVGQFEEGHQK